MDRNPATATPKHTPLLQKLMHLLSITAERELTCAEADDLFDYYAELQERGENVQTLMPQIAQHLRICPECDDEYHALLEVIASLPNSNNRE